MADSHNAPAEAAQKILLLPADAFFVRLIPLVAGEAVAPQVEIALENLSPFPRTQLYYGYLLSSTQTSALIFAAYQKKFSREEVGRWATAEAVLPEFLGLLGETPVEPTIRVWHQPGRSMAAAWNGQNSLPLAVVSSSGDELPTVVQAALVEKLQARTSLGPAALQVYQGAGLLDYDQRKNVIRWALSAETPGAVLRTAWPKAAKETADVRDPSFLQEQRQLRSRDLQLWRGLVFCLAGLAAALVLEIGLVAGRQWLGRAQTQIQRRADAVSQIETAQGLSARIEELTQKQLRPFEMLALINALRPPSIQFHRSITIGVNKLEVEAQTGNAADVSRYEKQLRDSAALTAVVTRDLRSRDGVTTFILTITFKPEALRAVTRS